MKEKSRSRNLRFELRTSETEKAKISRLARRWNVSESEAIRLAVAHSLKATTNSHFSFPPTRQKMGIT